MFSRTEIKYMAGAGAYSKGVDLYASDRVTQFTVEEDETYDFIFAQVKGSGKNYYNVTFSLNKEDETMEDSFCECRAYAKYSGFCEHCVAVLLEYNDYLDRKNTIEAYAQKQTASLQKLGEIQKGMRMETTPVLRELLQKQAVARSLPLIQESVCGKVRLEPHLVCGAAGAKLDFRIGINKLYVLKNIFNFESALDNHENYKYGKNLQFIHTMEAFDEESVPLVKYIRKWAQQNRDAYRANSYYGYYYGAMENIRYMELSGRELEEFLLLMGDRVIQADVETMPEKEWHVTRERLPRRLKIVGSIQGIELETQYFFSCGKADEYYIYLHNGKIYMEKSEDIEQIEDFVRCMNKIPGGKAFIEKADIPAFCKELLPALEARYDCEMIKFNPADYGLTEPEFKIYLDAPQENMITCKPVVRYGKKEYSIYTTEEIAQRDMVKEAVIRKLLHEYGNAYDTMTKSVVIMDDDELVYDLLVNGIPQMQAVAEVYISNELKKLEVKKAPKVSVGVSINGNLLELTMTAGDMKKEELIDILSRYNRKKKFYRLKDGGFVDAQDSGLDTVAELRNGLQLTDKQLKQDKIEVQKYRALYLDTQLKENPAVSAIKDRAFRSLVRNMKTVEDNDFEIPESLEKVLREYQKNGFLWIKTLKNNGFGGILADDMGLGKTLQVICFLLSEYQESKKKSRALIVAPASLVYNWHSEIERFAPELVSRMVVGTAAERKKILEEAGEGEILLTSYDLLKRDIDLYKNHKFDCEVIDEAQYIKNQNTQVAKAVKLVDADFRLALTGTPVENRLSELWSIFDYLMPGFLYSYKKFRSEMEIPIIQDENEDAMKRLQKMIRPFVLRRLKKDVLSDLPDKLEENMYAKLEGEQQKLYDAHVKRMKLLLDGQTEEEFKTSKIMILAELTKLRQLCCDPAMVFEDYKGESAKADMCMSLIQNAVESGHKILLFSQFTTMLDSLSQRLEEEKISYYMLTGSTDKETRAKLVEAFNKDETSVFCISLKAGGTGLNLTAADIVIHFDPWWNLAVQNQATDRAHRIGQKNVVNVYKLIVKGTIEENIVKLQEKKRELADQILSGESLSTGSMTKEELLELLGE